MASIFYIPSVNGMEHCYRALLETAVSHKKCRICGSYDELTKMLHKPFSDVKVAVLFAAGKEEITRILSLGDLLADVKIILVLADKDKETMVMAHRLLPRYVTWMDSDLNECMDVFKKMVGLYDSP